MNAGTAAEAIGEFADGLEFSSIPQRVVEASELLILDALGTALAASREDFAHRAERAVGAIDGEVSSGGTVIGRSVRLPLRDAAMLNGMLIHGLDYDDTHPSGVLHPTASALPVALGVVEQRGLSGREIVLGHVLAVETTTRLGAAASGDFHGRGFHPTGVLGVFGAAVAAAKLTGLSASGITGAQGMAGSLASGLLEFIGSGAWTKRLHPGWASASGILAAALAAEEFVSPETVYEGRYGLYNSFLGRDHTGELTERLRTLGSRWETEAVAVKPYPACHFVHAFVDAVLALGDEHDLAPDQIEQVHCLIADEEIQSVFEPLEAKRCPQSTYEAQFSVPHAVASALTRRRFTRAELAADVRDDPAVRRIAARTGYSADPDSAFPEAFSGEVRVRTSDGSWFTRREQINRGARERRLSADEVHAKFEENVSDVLPRSRARQMIGLVSRLPDLDDPGPLLEVLAS